MAFSKPFEKHGTWTNTTITKAATPPRRMTARHHRLLWQLPSPRTPQEVDVRIGVSYVDLAGALANLKAEMPDNNFERYHQQTVQDGIRNWAPSKWKAARLTITGFSTRPSTTASSPRRFSMMWMAAIGFRRSDTSGPEATNISTPPFRVGHLPDEIPLLALIAPERVQDMAQSLVRNTNKTLYRSLVAANRATAIMNGDPNTIVLVNVWNAACITSTSTPPTKACSSKPWPKYSRLPARCELYDEERNGITINPDASVATALEHELSFAAW